MSNKEIGIASYNAGQYQLSAGLIQDGSLTKVSETIKTLVDNGDLASYNLNIRPVPVGSDPGQNVSYVLVECTDARNNPRAVGYTAIVLASSLAMSDLPTQRYNVRQAGSYGGDQPVEVKMADSDVCDPHLLKLIHARITRLYPQITDAFFLAEPTVLPRVFNFADQDQIRRVLVNAINAANLRLQTSLGEQSKFEDFTLENRSALGTEDVEVVFTDDTMTDDVGLPRRADLRVVISTTAGNPNERNNRIAINGEQAASVVAEIGGFVDLTWDCQASAPNSLLAGFQQNQQQSVPKMYRPRVIFTTQRTARISSLPMKLLALATSIATLEVDNGAGTTAGRRVREYFVSATKSSSNPYRDLGAVGFDLYPLMSNGTQRSAIPTKGENASPDQLLGLLQQILHPQTYALDIPEYGPDSWTLTPFMSAALGNEAAIKELHSAADYLTGGKYRALIASKYGGILPQPVINDNNRLHAGYYQDGVTSRIVDMRNVDMLMVLNRYGLEQVQEVNAWSQSFAAINSSLEQRVAKRWETIADITAGSAHQTGWTRRYTLGGDFFRILIEAINQCEYSPNVRDTQQFSGLGELRQNSSFLQGGVVGQTSQLFNQNQPRSQNNRGFGGMTTRFDQFQ